MMNYKFSVMTVALTLMMAGTQMAWSQEAALSHHRTVDGIIVDKAGSPAVKVPDGTVYQLNRNRALRHGHKPFKSGDEVTVIIDEGNAVLEVHPKGMVMNHRFITGDVVSVGLRQGTITLKTSEGEQSFPLEKRQMSASIRDGSTVRAEVNEAGSVIDVHPIEHKQLDPNEKQTPINRSH